MNFLLFLISLGQRFLKGENSDSNSESDFVEEEGEKKNLDRNSRCNSQHQEDENSSDDAKNGAISTVVSLFRNFCPFFFEW
ncbi:hypothetical protein CEXT_104231 [Caerostris extrusa]|uniref:Uncharacterized protein n=1 Tax=Caerostris extrusa TaxID=172846 RepID=A0AAV4VCJ9_CAEEX|nr:hypothetical protein CEXT_104231 [Caerostris extrusa]